MDAVDGVPYIAWNEPNGRTLADLHQKCRALARQVPIEHALLIAEKVATALDHAYNTTIDGDRTLHGLVWPGFVAISDDGDIRLAGFGLAAGVLPSIGRPRLASEVGPYLAEEERRIRSRSAGTRTSIPSGVLLLELLTGHPPPPDPLAFVKGTAPGGPPPLQPEILALLRMTLAPAESRYSSSGDLRRELGKLLFSGPYSPSTFNLAYFLNDQFRDEIEAETRARKREAALEMPGGPARSVERRFPAAPPVPAQTVPAASSPSLPIPPPAKLGRLPAADPVTTVPEPARRSRSSVRTASSGDCSRRSPWPAASTSFRGERRTRPACGGADGAPTPAPTRTLLPELQPTPSGPTTRHDRRPSSATK